MSDLSNYRILVVDDEDDIRSYLVMALEDAGFTVDEAVNGFDALDKVKENPPHLISLDLVMPERSGAKCYRDLQKNPDWAKIPVILVTGHARDEQGKIDFEELTMSGVGVYLEKPVTPEKYVTAVCTTLGVDVPEDMLDQDAMKDELQRSLENASPEDIKRALEALRKK